MSQRLIDCIKAVCKRFQKTNQSKNSHCYKSFANTNFHTHRRPLLNNIKKQNLQKDEEKK